jgi:hypothetical protein
MWLDFWYDSGNDGFQYYGDGTLLTNLTNVLTMNTMEKAKHHFGHCIRARINPLNSTNLLYERAFCNDKAQFICLMDFQVCKNKFKKVTGSGKNKPSSKSLNYIFDPKLAKELKRSISIVTGHLKQAMKAMDLTKSFPALFELFWQSRHPCHDDGSTTFNNESQPMISNCAWKGDPVPCSDLFRKFPTDHGMCCTFNLDASEIMEKSLLLDNILLQQSLEKVIYDSGNHGNIFPKLSFYSI